MIDTAQTAGVCDSFESHAAPRRQHVHRPQPWCLALWVPSLSNPYLVAEKLKDLFSTCASTASRRTTAGGGRGISFADLAAAWKYDDIYNITNSSNNLVYFHVMEPTPDCVAHETVQGTWYFVGWQACEMGVAATQQ
eukprot:3198541-Amphidinium_carterae.1